MLYCYLFKKNPHPSVADVSFPLPLPLCQLTKVPNEPSLLETQLLRPLMLPKTSAWLTAVSKGNWTHTFHFHINCPEVKEYPMKKRREETDGERGKKEDVVIVDSDSCHMEHILIRSDRGSQQVWAWLQSSSYEGLLSRLKAEYSSLSKVNTMSTSTWSSVHHL